MISKVTDKNNIIGKIKDNINIYNEQAASVILKSLEEILDSEDIEVYTNDDAILVYNTNANLISICVGDTDKLSEIWSSVRQELRLKRNNIKVKVNAPKSLVNWLLSEGFVCESEGMLLDTLLTSLVCDLSLTPLGSKVMVQVDKPYGHNHNYIEDEINQVNGGYIVDEHGNFLDAYVCGIYEEVSCFEGYVVGIVTKRDGQQYYLVNKDKTYDKKKCIDDIAFEQQYHDITLEWL